jgi:Sap-like sulfolipid-1-addressing protein
MVGLPNLYLLAAIAAILDAGVGTSTQVGALTVFSVVAFLHAVIPLASFLVAPEATRDSADRLYAWLNAHRRPVVTTLATVAGVYLLIKGISSL